MHVCLTTSMVHALGHACARKVKSETVSRPSKDVATVPSRRNSTVAAHFDTRPGGLPMIFEIHTRTYTHMRNVCNLYVITTK